ncbi:hypothetical protein GOP47_0019795 [Adiantum capillus-veneris]|uniref:Uncharacterized protein n=1 Tax=Adiantum capillus-veneris TaxID=13818 RepID=A0A9D4UC70_ADICA|nr:hypothetical protein GOP47_0019795 [Adiantum capillus-veneris]
MGGQLLCPGLLPAETSTALAMATEASQQSDTLSEQIDAWSIQGFLQKTSRHNIRKDICEDDESLYVFRT